jgi:RloB-like protein
MRRGSSKTRGSQGRSTSPTRIRRKRVVKRKILIICEAEKTEPGYFRGLRDEESVKRKCATTVKKVINQTPEKVVERAIEIMLVAKSRGEHFDEVWCVLDVEGANQNNPESIQEAVKLAEANNINLCLSNPCFEVWLLAHFVQMDKYFKNYDAVKKVLDKHWNTNFKQKYDKSNTDIYRRIFQFTAIAIERAELVRKNNRTLKSNSYTDVYKIVKLLLGNCL